MGSTSGRPDKLLYGLMGESLSGIGNKWDVPNVQLNNFKLTKMASLQLQGSQ